MSKISITSDVKQKLFKIKEGKTFDDPYIVLNELFQNSYRAKAKTVVVLLEEDKLTFMDNGCGCAKPENVLTLDFSEWFSTDEGFGLGLWSWLGVPNAICCKISSKKWEATIDAKELFKSGEPNAEIKWLDEPIKGFCVEITSPFFRDNYSVLLEKIKEIAEIQPYNTTLNGEAIPEKDLMSNVNGDYVMEFHNNLFDCKLSITDYAYDNPELYYEKRSVQKLYVPEPVKGIIEMKKNGLTLKEPDRKQIINDEKRCKFIDKLRSCIKELYMNFVKQAEQEMINKYAKSISDVLNVKDYEKWIFTDMMEEDMIEETRTVPAKEIYNKAQAAEYLSNYAKSLSDNGQLSIFEQKQTEQDKQNILKILNSTLGDAKFKWVKTNEVDTDTSEWATCCITDDYLESASAIIIGGVIYRKTPIEDITSYQQDDEECVENISITTIRKKNVKNNLVDVIRKSPLKVWMKASEAEENSELRARAEYYKIRVFVAKNVLYETVLKFHDVPHISQIDTGIEKRFIKTDVEIKTGKEKAFLELLQPICRYYDIPYNTFLIGNLKLYIETRLQDKVVNREIKDNKNKIEVYAVCEGSRIILDRKALCLKRFNLSEDENKKLGINEYKAIMATAKTTAHELSHLLYGTNDNTVDHYKVEDQLYHEIVNLYLMQ